MVPVGHFGLGSSIAFIVNQVFLHRTAYFSEAHEPGWPDIFFFHGTFDTQYPGGGSISGLIATLFVFSSLIVIYFLEIKRLSAKARKSN